MSFEDYFYEFETPNPDDDLIQNDLDRATLYSTQYSPNQGILEETSMLGNEDFMLEQYETEMPKTIRLDEEISAVLQSDNMKLKVLIEKLLQGVEPNDQELQELHDLERNIFLSIKEKKLFTDEERNNKGKRAEEKQKLFFKSVLKHIENAFFENFPKNNKKKSKKKERDQGEFYNHYFLETARRLKIDISNFYHPNKKIKRNNSPRTLTSKSKKDSNNAGLKSLNSTYIDLILSSEKFRCDALNFLEENFVQDYIKTRYKKIDKLLAKLKKIIKRSFLQYKVDQLQCQDQDRLIITQSYDKLEDFLFEEMMEEIKIRQLIYREIRETILYNSKSKLPWSNLELFQAREYARSAFIKNR